MEHYSEEAELELLLAYMDQEIKSQESRQTARPDMPNVIQSFLSATVADIHYKRKQIQHMLNALQRSSRADVNINVDNSKNFEAKTLSGRLQRVKNYFLKREHTGLETWDAPQETQGYFQEFNWMQKKSSQDRRKKMKILGDVIDSLQKTVPPKLRFRKRENEPSFKKLHENKNLSVSHQTATVHLQGSLSIQIEYDTD